MHYVSGRRLLGALLLLALCPWVMAAPDVTAEVPLDFGTLAVKNNATVGTLSVSTGGALTYSEQIAPIGGAVQGEYRLSGFPPGVLLELEWDDVNLSAGGGGLPEFLQVTGYTNPTLVSDESGAALVPLGATLRTNGSGVMYVDAPYSGTTQVRVRYWSEVDGGYLTHFDSVTFSARVQSALTLLEDQALSFGTVAAWAESGNSATLTLAPNGALEASSAGDARLTPLGGAQVGVIRLTGAAPSHSVTITPEAGSIFLTHEIPGDIARFIVRDFVTSPAGSGFTDASGELEIRVGATLETEQVDKPYENGTYSGEYSLTVSY